MSQTRNSVPSPSKRGLTGASPAAGGEPPPRVCTLGDGAEGRCGGLAEAPGPLPRPLRRAGSGSGEERTGEGGPCASPAAAGASGPARPPTSSLGLPLPPSPRPLAAAGVAPVLHPTGPLTQRGYVRTAPSRAVPAVRGGLTRLRVGGSHNWSIPKPGDPKGTRSGPGPAPAAPQRPQATPPP